VSPLRWTQSTVPAGAGLLQYILGREEPHFRLAFRYGENSGDSRHAEPHARTSCHYQILLLNPLLSEVRLKRKDFQEIARLAWAQEVLSSNLGTPTKTSRVFSVVYRKPTSPKTGLWNSRRQEVSIHKSFNSKDFATWQIFRNTRRQECYSETIERTQVNRPPSDKHGENSGDPVHFSSTQSSELQIGDHALVPARASQRLSICRLNGPVLNRSDVFIRERQRRLLRHGLG
jgi:hypothetical protein